MLINRRFLNAVADFGESVLNKGIFAAATALAAV